MLLSLSTDCQNVHVTYPIAGIIVATIFIFVVLKRRKNSNWKTSPSPALNNPSYMDTTGLYSIPSNNYIN